MKARAVQKFVLLILFSLVGISPAVTQKTVYRSNGFGMAMGEIASYRRDEYEFVLEVDKKPGSEVRRLYKNGAEVRRWETVSIEDGKKRENEYEEGKLAATRMLGASGELLREETFLDGELRQKAVYEYVKGNPVGVKVTAADGTLVYSDELRLSTRGALREVRRTFADGGSAFSVFLGVSGVGGEEWDSLAGITLVIRYDGRARAVEKEQWKGETLISAEKLVFRGDSDLLSESTEDRPESDTRVERIYDEQGRLSTERILVEGKLTEQTSFVWDGEGRNTEKRRRGPDGIEEWRYSYDASGTLELAEYFLRGSLAKKTYYTAKGERNEEYYREGEMFLRVYYSGDVKTREEVFEDGVLVRERSFE